MCGSVEFLPRILLELGTGDVCQDPPETFEEGEMLVVGADILAGLEVSQKSRCMDAGDMSEFGDIRCIDGEPRFKRGKMPAITLVAPVACGGFLQLPELFEGVERLLKGEPRFLFFVTLDLFGGATVGLRDGCGTGLDRLQEVVGGEFIELLDCVPVDGCTGRAGDDLLGQSVAPTGLPSAGGEAVEVSATLATAFARLGHVLLQLLAQGLVG